MVTRNLKMWMVICMPAISIAANSCRCLYSPSWPPFSRILSRAFTKLQMCTPAGCWTIRFPVHLKLGPDCSCSGSRLWLVRMWTGPRVPIQDAQVTRITGSCGSDCCRYIKGRLAILRTIKLALVIKTSSSLAMGSSLVQAWRVTELQCEQPLQVNASASVLVPP